MMKINRTSNLRKFASTYCKSSGRSYWLLLSLCSTREGRLPFVESALKAPEFVFRVMCKRIQFNNYYLRHHSYVLLIL